MQVRVEVEGGSCIATIFNNGIATVMWLDDVKVDPSKWRQGVGTALMEAAERLTEVYRVDCIELVVNPENIAAKGLYAKVGFNPTKKEHYRKILKQLEIRNNAAISSDMD